MTETELAAEIKAGTLRGMYFFYGDEDYLKNHRAAQIRDAILPADDTMRAFNLFEITFGEGEADFSPIRNAMEAPPMMSPVKLVSLFFPALDSYTEKERSGLLELLASYAEGYDDTVLIVRASGGGFDPGTAKKPSPFLREASKFMKPVAFDYQSPPRLIRWMERHAAEYGLTLAPGAGEAMIAACGTEMYRLSGEIRKTAAYVAAAGRGELTPQDVAVCVSRRDEDDAFRLANCILAGDTKGALACLGVKMRLREAPIFVLSQVTRAFADLAAASAFLADGREKSDFARSMKIHEYRAGMYFRAVQGIAPAVFGEIMELCTAADRQMKSGVSDYTALERLICLATERMKEPPPAEESENPEGRRV